MPAKPRAKPEIIEIPKGFFRLELGDTFWQIGRRNPRTLSITSGTIGTAGTTTLTEYKQDSEAQAAVDKQLEELVRKGYCYVLRGQRVVVPAGSIDPALEQTIAKDPASDDAYLVYADWLMQQNDVRGELASLNARRAKKPTDKVLANAEAQLLRAHRAYFWGPLAVYLRTKHLDRGDPVVAAWRHGWMDTLRFAPVRGWWADDNERFIRVIDMVELVRLLPAVASARLVRKIVIARPDTSTHLHFGAAIEALAKVIPKLSALRALVLGEFAVRESELSWTNLGSAKPLWPTVRTLEYLKIRAGGMDLGEIDAPQLRELWIETGGFTKKNLAAIVAANLPELETLNLWFGQSEYGYDLSPEDYAPLLASKRFSKLVHLGLANSPHGNELLAMVATSKLLPNLETLDLSMSHTTLRGIEAVAKSTAFRHLAKLDLSRCLLNEEAQTLARTLCKTVVLDDQADEDEYRRSVPDERRDDVQWRYSAVGE